MRFAKRRLAAALVLSLAAGMSDAQAASTGSGQAYPSRPVRVVVPVGPGGGLDFVARLIGLKLTDSLGQSIVVDNRPGASGTIGLELTARAAPDGHTLLVMGAGHVAYAIIYKTSYDLFRDFTPVSQVTASAYIFAVHPVLPSNSVSELTAYARANPGKLNYGSTGNGTLQHLATELYGVLTGVKLVHVPYKGLGAAFPDLLSGRIHMIMASTPSIVSHLRSGTLRPLAVTGARRVAALPELPTMIEAGVPGFDVTQWQGMLAPAGTPRPIVERLHRDITKALQQSDVASRLANDGTDGVGSPPREFAAFLKAEHAKWADVVKQTGIRADTP